MSTDTQTENLADLAETLSPGSTDISTEPREQRIRGLTGSPYEDFDRTYVQRKLSFFNKVALGKIISTLVNAATDDGDTDLLQRLGSLYQRDENGQIVVGEDGIPVRDMRAIMMAVIPKVVELVPDQWAELYLIALGVPNHEKAIVREIFQQPQGEDGSGGLSDEDGVAILELFVAQNSKAIQDLFFDHLLRIWSRITDGGPTTSQTEDSSKPSKRTRRSTRKA